MKAGRAAGSSARWAAIDSPAVTRPVVAPPSCSSSSVARRTSPKDESGPADECLAERGRRHPPGPPLEQAKAELALQLGQAPGDGGLADAQRAGGAADAARLGGGDDFAQLAELHDRLRRDDGFASLMRCSHL